MEEADEDEGNQGNLGTEGTFDEKEASSEKGALHLQDIGIGGEVDVTNGIGKEIRLARLELDLHALR